MFRLKLPAYPGNSQAFQPEPVNIYVTGNPPSYYYGQNPIFKACSVMIPNILNTESHYHQPALERLTAIVDALHRGQDFFNDNPGILGGKAGIALLFGYSYLFSEREQDLDACYRLLGELADTMATTPMSHSFSSGLAGIGFCFQHLEHIGIIEGEDNMDLSLMDERIREGMELDLAAGDWDCLHGLTGLGSYLLERHKQNSQAEVLNSLVNSLADLREPGGPLWITKAYSAEQTAHYNLGMAHGLPGIVSFLSKVYAAGIATDKIPGLISPVVDFILSARYPAGSAYSFPGRVELEAGTEDAEGCRLGWCYGDLSVAFALLHSGHSLGIREWKNLGIDIALLTTKRTTGDALCRDACFCHGSAGLLHQYNRLYQNTGLPEFKEAALYWLDATLNKFYHPELPVAGYPYCDYDAVNNTWPLTADPSLLQGAAGVGLVLLGLLGEQPPDWDSPFFTYL